MKKRTMSAAERARRSKKLKAFWRNKKREVDGAVAASLNETAWAPKKLSKGERALEHVREEAYAAGCRETRIRYEAEARDKENKHREEMQKVQTSILTQLSYMMQYNADFMEGAFRVIDRMYPKEGR